MNRIAMNIILILVFVAFSVIIVLPFIAELQFGQAIKSEKEHKWQKAEKNFLEAVSINPFNSEYFAKYADCLVDKSLFIDREKTSLFESAEKIYQKAIWINPQHAEYRYLLGKVQLELKDKKGAFDSFQNTIERDRHNLHNNYLVGFEMLKSWDSLNDKQKTFVLGCLERALKLEPWYGSSIYPAILYYAKDFKLALDVAPKTYLGYKILYSFLEKKNLWKYRKKVKDLLDIYRQREQAEEFKKEQIAKIERINKLKKEKAANDFISPEQWQGKSEDGGNNIYNNGNMYWTGTMYCLIDLPKGEFSIKIQAKGEQTDNIWPYMIVELDGEEIGDSFVDSPDWVEYSFAVDTNGGQKVLSITFVNDGSNTDKGEDRNLYIGDVKIESGAP